MEREQFEERLQAVFGVEDPDTLAVLSRQARDLADAGRIEADLEEEATAEAIIDHLQDAPADHTVVERWNWWVGSLEMSYGGYQRFRVRPDVVE